MFFALVLMNLVHPGRILVGPESEFPKGKSRKEKREAKKEKREAKKAKKEEAKAEKAKKRVASENTRAGGTLEDGEFIV